MPASAEIYSAALMIAYITAHLGHRSKQCSQSRYVMMYRSRKQGSDCAR